MTKAIQIENLHYSYGTSDVLQGLSFTVSLGDFFVIIGPNGSGKTTLMKLITGIIKPQKGHLHILGRHIKSYSRKRLARTIAYVPQTTLTDFPFNVTDLVLMGRSPHLGMLGLEQEKDLMIAKKAMIFTGIEHLAKRRIDQLSGGECQRVSIARAICQEPRIIVMDEPTASLDLSHQVRIMDLLERLRENKGVTVVMVSHDVNLAAMYGDRLLLLKNGQIVNLGSPREVLNYRTLEETYGCKLVVDESPVGRFLRVSLVPGKMMK